MNAIAPLAEFAGAQQVIDAWFTGMALDPPQLVWEWAEANLVLTPEMAAEPGPYSLKRTPFLREILTNLSPSSPVIGTILMKGSQVGASQAGLAFLVFLMVVSGGPSLVVCPTVGAAELFSKQRLEPLINACEAAVKKMPRNRGKESGNKILLKVYPGGIMRLVGAGAVNPLKSMPVKVVFFEEPDEFEPDLEGQGPATGILLRRITTFGKRAKWYAPCTPGLASRSIVNKLFLTGDQREYRMPCPHCGFLTSWNKDTIRFQKRRPETAHMVCESAACGKPIHEGKHKTEMMEAGVWVPKIKDAPPDMPRSYYLPAFYSPWKPWSNIAKAIEAADGNYELSKLLWNQTYGLPWADSTDRPDPGVIYRRALLSGYASRQLPAGVLFLTAGVDVGGDHIEISVWGWGRDKKRWLIEHIRLGGKVTDPSLWDKAEQVLQRGYIHSTGAVLKLKKVAVDRAKWPDIVVPWVRKQDPNWIVAIWGSQKIDAPILKDAKWILTTDDGMKHQTDFTYWKLGVGLLKLELYNNLNRLKVPGGEDPPGSVFLPNDVSADYCEQLVSEEYITVPGKNGSMKSSWQRIGSNRAEALDCANYARAMAELIGWSHWTSTDFEAAEKALEALAAELQASITRERVQRVRKGDTRPVTLENFVSHIAYPDGQQPPEPAALPEPIVVPAAPVPAVQGSKAHRGFGGAVSIEGGIERPAEIGVAGAGDGRTDFRAVMRRRGMGRSASYDE